MQTFTAPTTGTYNFTVAGAQGGTTPGGSVGGLGATVVATALLKQGAVVPIIVGGQGLPGPYDNSHGAGGGGLTAVYTNGVNLPTIVAGTVSSLPDVCHRSASLNQ